MGAEERIAISPGDVLRAYVGAFVEELALSGVRNVCLCPGSRSTPLALMLREHENLKVWVHLDERSAGFFALGMARVLRGPVALVCTSGTAAVNFAPAIVEAFYSRVPLVVLTSDRPAELRGVGANQTIDQVRLYGNHVKWSEEMMLPEATPAALHYARATAGRAVHTATFEPPGPVHLNLPFREPLVPSMPGSNPAGQDAPAPSLMVSRGRRELPESSMAALVSEIEDSPRGLIICGPQDDEKFPPAVARLAEASGFPILADALSQVRCGPHVSPAIIAGFDNFLRDRRLAQQLSPQIVLRFGAAPVSKPLSQFLERNSGAKQYVISDGDTWTDPERSASRFLFADPAHLCGQLAASLGRRGSALEQDEWRRCWADIATSTEASLTASLCSELSEPQVFRSLSRLLPAGSLLYAGNSMPVRDLDSFFPACDRPLTFLANRGTSGIDGVVSSALGAAAASGRRLVLVIGDLSFYHDLNGLLAIKRHGIQATIVLLNNDGGGIFSFLPQAEEAGYFEDLFGTPHGLDFRPAAEMYGLVYSCPGSVAEFEAITFDSLAGEASNLIEVKTDRTENVAVHNRIWQAVAAALHAEGPS